MTDQPIPRTTEIGIVQRGNRVTVLNVSEDGDGSVFGVESARQDPRDAACPTCGAPVIQLRRFGGGEPETVTRYCTGSGRHPYPIMPNP